MNILRLHIITRYLRRTSRILGQSVILTKVDKGFIKVHTTENTKFK